MKCKQTAILISAYIDGELNNDETKLVESHINSCAECKMKYELLKKTDVFLSANKSAATSPYFETRFFERLKDKESNTSASDLFVIEKKLLYTFAALLIIVSAVTFRSYLVNGSISYTTIQSYITGSNYDSVKASILNKDSVELDDIVKQITGDNI